MRGRAVSAAALALAGFGELVAAQEAGLVASTTIIDGASLGAASLDFFGWSVVALGDLDLDGIDDIAVGDPEFDYFGEDFGTVCVLFLDEEGGVREQSAITPGSAGFTPSVDVYEFGQSLASVGDLDGDGISELAVGSGRGYYGTATESVWILFLDGRGGVRSWVEISDGNGGLPAGSLRWNDRFGASVAAVGDMNGDGLPDLAVGAPDDDEYFPLGAVWLLFLGSDGTVSGLEKISAYADLDIQGFDFGQSVTGLGDLDGNGMTDLAVGGHEAIWIVLLRPDGTVQASTKIDAESDVFGGALLDDVGFGWAVAGGQDADGDGIGDLLASTSGDDDGGNGVGAVWLLLLRPDGTVRGFQKFGATAGDLQPPLVQGDHFGSSLALLPDSDGNGALDFLVAASGYGVAGGIWTLHLGRCAEAATALFRNPGGVNPPSLAWTPPLVGRPAIATIDLASTGHFYGTVLGFLGPRTQQLRGGQMLLVDGASPGGELLQLPLRPGPLATFTVRVPETLAVCGIGMSTQALHLFGRQPFALSNAIDLAVGY